MFLAGTQDSHLLGCPSSGFPVYRAEIGLNKITVCRLVLDVSQFCCLPAGDPRSYIFKKWVSIVQSAAIHQYELAYLH